MKVFNNIGRKIVCCMMLFSFIISGYATGSTNYIPISQRSMLEEMGLPDSIIDIMPMEDILLLLSAYQENPEKIYVSSDRITFNPLEKISQYMSMSTEEKIQNGFTENDILQIDQQISEFREMSNEDLISLGIPGNEADMYRQTLQSGIVPYGEGDVTSSEMDFSLVVYDTSDVEGPDYQAFVYFNWIQPFFMTELEDKVIVAWGGDLVLQSHSANVTYKVYSNGKWGAVSSSQEVDYYDNLSALNESGYYYFDQSDRFACRAQYGRFAFTLEQLGYDNKYSKLVVQYAHQVFAVTGVNAGININFISGEVGPEVSLDISTAYDTSPQRSYRITY